MKRKRKIIKTEPVGLSEGIKIFLRTARLDLINAVRSACRNKFPQTVEILDGLSEAETQAIRNGGLLSLPQPKIDALEAGMKKDKFIWN